MIYVLVLSREDEALRDSLEQVARLLEVELYHGINGQGQLFALTTPVALPNAKRLLEVLRAPDGHTNVHCRVHDIGHARGDKEAAAAIAEAADAFGWSTYSKDAIHPYDEVMKLLGNLDSYGPRVSISMTMLLVGGKA